ncbi:MAG: hypothetical protein K2K88_06475 [Muribaculaceae bacterium]|nr:hypothetical protein [Muribaculaceae bacterium]MDE6352762.1 hypothetical protein [Muribaculaceae bacterium]
MEDSDCGILGAFNLYMGIWRIFWMSKIEIFLNKRKLKRRRQGNKGRGGFGCTRVHPYREDELYNELSGGSVDF